MIIVNDLSQINREKTVNISIDIIRKVGFITLAVSVFSSFSFLITYSFLYGYYFSGDVESSFSNFELIRRFIPFHLNTILFTYLLLALSSTLIIYLFQLFIKKGWVLKGIVLVLLLVFHLILTTFFTEEPSNENILNFSIIWLFPLFFGIISAYFIQGIRNVFKIFSGSLFGFICFVFFDNIFPNILDLNELSTLFIIMIFIFGIIFSLIPFSRLGNVILTLPFVLLILMTFNHIIKISFYQNLPLLVKILVFLFISLIGSWMVSRLLKKHFNNLSIQTNKVEEKDSVNKIISDVTTVFLSPKTHQGALIFLLLTLLTAYVFLPHISATTAKVIRSFTPNSELQFHTIKILNIEGIPETIKGIIVAEQDDVLYISNEGWELEQIKVESYYIEK